MYLKIKSLSGDITGGVVGALIVVPIILSCGVVLFHSIGPEFVTAGISAAFIASVMPALVSGLFGGPPLHINSPKTTHAAILAGLIATVATHHSFADVYSGDKAPAALMTICFLTLLVSGVTQALLGISRMGSLVKFIPYPVLAGFINGFALQIILNQAPKLFGLQQERQLLTMLTGWDAINWWALGFAAISGGLVFLTGRFTKAIPAAIVGLIGGTLAQLVVAKFVWQVDLGPVIGTLPAGISPHFRLDEILGFLLSAAFPPHVFQILATGVTLAFVSSIQSLLSISASEHISGGRHKSNRELVVQGAGNILSAIFGGAPSGGSPNVTQTVFSSGGRTGAANLAYAATLLGLSYGLSQIIGLIPLSAMAGVVVITTAGAMDKWTQQLIIRIGSSSGSPASRQDLALNLVVVILVATLVVSAGALAALGVGMAAVFMVFLYRSNTNVIRRVLHGDRLHSRTERSHAAFDALTQHGLRIAVIEVDGPIFFGSAETVAQSIERELTTSDWIILDLKRVSHFDSSGVMMLKRLDDRMLKSNQHLLLSHLPQGGNRRNFLRTIGLTAPESQGRIYEDTDEALSWVEDELLTTLNFIENNENEVELKQFEACRGMDEEELHLLKEMLNRQKREAGDVIIREGEACRSLFFLALGRVSVQLITEDRVARLASFRAGVACGGMALLSDQTHSASVVAETAVVLMELTVEAWERLKRMNPGVESKLIRNLIDEISYRVHNLNIVVRELEA